MESFNAIPIFIAVTDNAGFSSAARQLGISKSAVSKRITQLEDQLGARLFHRTTRKLSLTEAGERFYEYAAQANRSAQQAEDAVHELKGEPRGILKIQLPMTLGQMHIAPLIPIFLQRYPHLEIDLVMDDRHINLVEQGYDLAVRAGDMPDSNLIARPLAPLHSVVCASPKFLQAFEQQFEQTLDQPPLLTKANCITYSYSSNANIWQFVSSQASKPSHKIKVSGNYRVNNSAALKQALIAGMGIGRLPTFIVGDAIKRGELVALFQDYKMPSKSLYAVYPERQYLPTKVRAFLDFLIEKLGQDIPYWDEF
ncbi:MAG: DNA-binding transcriptional LysR family regulator [Oleispira sp.]|jgi:DNA-binding transcriptional LysR family regulator